MSFTHLHVHSHFSLNDALCSIDDLIEATKSQGGKYVALTDHGFMYGVYDFYKKVKEAGLVPIIGLEAYYTSRYAGSKELGQEERKHQYHITILAKNNTGYRNLLKLASDATTIGQYYVPCIDDELLEKYSEGLIVLSGCMSGYLSRKILNNEYDKALEKAEKWQKIFGEDFYLEVQKHPVLDWSNIPSQKKSQEEFVDGQNKIIEGIKEISKKTGIPMVATNDVHYITHEDYELHDIMLAIRDKKKVFDEDRFRYSTDQFYFKTKEEMLELFPIDVVERSYEIAQKCNVSIDEIDNPETLMPHFPKLPEHLTEKEYLRQLSYEGLFDLGWGDKTKYVDRLEEELEVITRLGWEGYFLILWDIMKFCKLENIPVGKSRGSAGGSLVSRCLDIIKIDPVKHDLLFSRFLNEHRISAPDIDSDISQERRMEVVNYITETYGKDHVVSISTVNLHKARAALKSVATALSVDFGKANHLSSLVPNTDTPLIEILKIEEVADMYNKDNEIRRVIDIAIQIQNSPSHVGVHAAGILISPVPIVNICPIRQDKDRVMTQWHMDQIEELGLLKVDILGLKTLDVISDTIKAIEQNKKEIVDLDTIALDDKKIYELLGKGDTSGVFQLESTLARNYLTKMKPQNFIDVANFVALIRPGPLDAPAPNGSGTMVDEFIRRLHGESRAIPPHPILGEILEETQQVVLYQEQIMRIVQVMAGFTEAEADTIRRIIGSKRTEDIPKARKQFTEGCLERGISKKDAEYIFSLLETFSNYGFNKCLAGDSYIYKVSPDQKSFRRVTIEELYQAWASQGIVGKKYRAHGIPVLGMIDNGIDHVKITNMWKTGVKEVYKITTHSGWFIKATLDHRFFTQDGWKELRDITVDDCLYSVDFDDLSTRWQDNFLLKKDGIVSISFVGEEETYDIEVKEHHNFIANGIVTHNSHAFGYGALSMDTAWLRANYYTEFMASLLTSVRNDSAKLNMYLQDCHSHGTKVLPPSINISTDTFVADKENIRFGLSAVKGVGTVALEAILKERKNGDFKSFEDFIFRAYGNAVNKTVLESFVLSGVFDEFGLSRAQMLESIAPIIKAYNSYKGKIKRIENREQKIIDIDDIAKLEIEREKLEKRRVDAEKVLKELVLEATNNNNVEKIDTATLAKHEKDILGFYVTNHPLDKYKKYINSLIQCPQQFVNSVTLKENLGKQVITCGYISKVTKGNVRYGKKIEFTLDDWTGTSTVIAYNRQYDAYQDMIKEGSVITVIGKVVHYPNSDFTYIQLSDADFPNEKPLPPKLMVYTEYEHLKNVLSQINDVLKKDFDDVPLDTVEYKVGVFYNQYNEVKEQAIRWLVSENELQEAIDKIYEIDGVYSVIPVK